MCLLFLLCIYIRYLQIPSVYEVAFSLAVRYFFLLPKIQKVKAIYRKSKTIICYNHKNNSKWAKCKGANPCIHLLLPTKLSADVFSIAWGTSTETTVESWRQKNFCNRYLFEHPLKMVQQNKSEKYNLQWLVTLEWSVL